MLNDGAIQLGFSLVAFVSAGLTLWTALMQATEWLHLLQLCVCCTFLPLTVALVVLSSLQLHWMACEGDISFNPSITLTL